MKSFKNWATRRLPLLLALTLMLVPAVVLAQTGDATTAPLSAVLNVEQNAITVGDVVTLDLSVTHPAGWRVLVPTLESTWSDLEIVQQHLPTIIGNEDGTETTTQQIEARLFAPGEYQTMPLTLTIVDDQGATQPYPVVPAAVTVGSVLVEGDTELRDIKPQANFSIETTSNPVPAIAGIGALGLGVLAAVIVLRKRGSRPEVDNRTPAERANDTLDALDALELADLETIKAFYAGVSQALRRYLSEALEMPLMDQTTAQIWTALQETPIPAEDAESIAQLLQACDTVKFTPNAPNADTTAQLTNHARQIISNTEQALATIEEAAA